MSVPQSKQSELSVIPDLTGYVAIVTGGNSGIGYEIAFQLARRNAHVYVAGRSDSRLQQAITSMRESVPNGDDLRLATLIMDLQSLHSVKAAVDTFLNRETRLDLLINNAGLHYGTGSILDIHLSGGLDSPCAAGLDEDRLVIAFTFRSSVPSLHSRTDEIKIMAPPFKLTKDGFETQWQTNFLAGHLLFTGLLPLLQSTAASSTNKSSVRVVNVSGEAAFVMGPKEFTPNDPNLASLQGTMAPFKRYGHSKLAGIVHAQAIDSRYNAQGISAYSVHPGIVNTNLQKGISTLLGPVIRATVKLGILPGCISVAEGAQAVLFCATSPDAPRGSGGYFLPKGVQSKDADKFIKDRAVVDGLWEAGEGQLRGADL